MGLALQLDPPVFAGLTAAALLTAALSAVVGMGGGVTLLGVMTSVLPPAWVVPLHGVVQLGSNGTRTVAFIRHVRWSIAGLYIPALLLGVAAAARVWSGENLGWFRPGIGVFLLLFLASRRLLPVMRNLPLWVYPPVAVVAGFASLFVGATGPLIAPFFLRDDMDRHEVIATKAMCQAAGHLLKIPAFLGLGFDYRGHAVLLGALLVAVVLGTLLGKRLLSRLSNATFVTVFEIVLTLLALHLIAGVLLP